MILYQYEKGYRYTSDVMFIYHFACLFKPSGSLLDVGCGCGILGLLLKRDFPSIRLSSVDVQQEHTLLTQKNSNENRLNTNTIFGDFVLHDFNERFDVIVSNPPFYHKDTKKSENHNLILSRYADSLPLDTFLSKSSMLLKTEGSLIFCYDAKQIGDIFLQSTKNRLKICDICFVHPRIDKESSLVLIRVKKNSKSFVKIHSPVIVFDGDDYTKTAKDIFKRADTKSINWQ